MAALSILTRQGENPIDDVGKRQGCALVANAVSREQAESKAVRRCLEQTIRTEYVASDDSRSLRECSLHGVGYFSVHQYPTEGSYGFSASHLPEVDLHYGRPHGLRDGWLRVCQTSGDTGRLSGCSERLLGRSRN